MTAGTVRANRVEARVAAVALALYQVIKTASYHLSKASRAASKKFRSQTLEDRLLNRVRKLIRLITQSQRRAREC